MTERLKGFYKVYKGFILRLLKLLSLFLAFGILELSYMYYLIFKVLSLYLFYPKAAVTPRSWKALISHHKMNQW